MRLVQRVSSIVVSALLAGACATPQPVPVDATPAVTPPPPTSTAPPPATGQKPAVTPPWTTALSPDVYIWAERATEGTRSQSLTIYANGVAILDDRQQFRVPVADVKAILAEFGSRDFMSIPEESPHGKRLRRRAGVRSKSFWRESIQTWEAKEDPRVTGLVDAIFERAMKFAGNAVSATSVDDGLRKLQSGELAPEAMTFALNIRPERTTPAQRDTYLLRIEHGVVIYAPFTGGEIDKQVEVVATASATKSLARDLLAADITSFPVNLYANEYVELRLDILGQEKNVTARRFANMQPATHGEHQTRFDRLVAAIDELRRRLF